MYRVPNALHALLINWARWCHLGAWPHPLPPTQCGSLEGNYTVPAWEALDSEEAVQQKPIRPNERDARKIQSAWEALEGFPRLALKAEYPAKVCGRTEAAGKLGLTIQQYENHLRIAVLHVEGVLNAVRT